MGDVSPNYLKLFEDHKSYPNSVSATYEMQGRQETRDVPISIPKLVGYYSLKPTPDGKMLANGEGIAVSTDELFISDDDFKRVFALNRRSGAISRKFRTDLLKGSSRKAEGPEGLDYVTGDGNPLSLHR